MPGFWETLQGNFSGAMDTYEKQKQDKRLRALQKLKFMQESGDVGTPVDPNMQQEIADYAPEGAGLIQDGAYTGSPEQQRMAEFRKFLSENPNAEPEQMMTRGVATGAVSPNAYSNYINSVEARASREQIANDNRLSREQIARDNNENRRILAGIAQAGMNARAGGGGNGGVEGVGTKADTQKWLANRKMFLPHGGPYNYITQKLLNDPESAKGVLSELEGYDDTGGLDSFDNWNRYLNYIMNNMDGIRDQYGLKNNELGALVNHVQVITNRRRKAK